MITSYTGFGIKFVDDSPLHGSEFIQFLGDELAAPDNNHYLIAVPCQVDSKQYLAGVVLRDRAAKHFTIREAFGGTEVIRPQKLGSGQNVVDINCFIIDTEHWRGLYSQYHLSVSLPAFLHLLERRYVAGCKTRKETELALNDVTPASRQGKEISKKWRKKISTSAIVPKEKLADIVSQFRKVENLEFAVDAVDYPDQDLVALSRSASTERHILRFNAAVQGPGIVAAVTAVVRKPIMFKKLRVTGTNAYGLRQTVTLDDVPERLGEDEYDSWVEKIELDTKSWSTTLPACPAIKRLIKLAGDRRVAAMLSATQT